VQHKFSQASEPNEEGEQGADGIRASEGAETHYGQFQHPNLAVKSKYEEAKGCAGCFWRFD